MTKPLSQMLEASEPHAIAKNATLVPRESYDRMKRVAIELAKGLAHIQSKKPVCAGCSCIEISLLEHYDCVAEQSISRAKDIIGGG